MAKNSAHARALSSPRAFHLLMNLYPPLLFTGVRVRHVAEDWSSVRVSHRVRAWNRNVNRSAFGGTLFAMTDPFYAVMAAGQLGGGYRIWNSKGAIEFLAPGYDVVTATMRLTPDEAAAIRARVDDTGRSVTTHVTEIRAADGTAIARATQDLHVRRLS
ncbi:DUF4442 domain-containing protein [Nocardia sp. NPDC050713]|uniref:DUF4442 domain-containing protein n=1 Tax=Nocardia sp. NPDC050713 TaxID=3154511 RepID=UPI0033E323CF